MKRFIVFCLFFLVFISGCSSEKTKGNGKQVTITLGAYTVTKEVYQKEIIPAFQKYWLEKTGQKVKFQESYIASGAQSRAIIGGFEADIAALSLEQDVERLRENGLITHDWKDNPYKGFVTRSVIVIAYRPDNPKKIKDWIDLTRDDISVLYPSPKTSGGAMWCINAIYGAGLKLTEVNVGKKDADYAKWLLKSIQKRVKVMDKSGRASVTTFENGIGDALVTYENEALLRQMEGRPFPFIIPEETVLIENPVALIDKNVDKHNNREAVEAFIQFLFTKESQNAFAKYGFRSVIEEVEKESSAKYPVPKHLFDIAYLGGWDLLEKDLFGPNGIWTAVIEEIAHEE
ncbi:MAG: sulfate ABC transporter substrate-binding protein [bacterium]